MFPEDVRLVSVPDKQQGVEELDLLLAGGVVCL